MFGFVASMWTNIPASTRMTNAATQRPGWRTGIALMASGALLSAVSRSVTPPSSSLPHRTSAGGGVELRRVHRVRVDVPLLQDLVVRAVLDQGVDRTLDRLLHAGDALRHADGVHGRLPAVADLLELGVALADEVLDDDLVGEHHVILAGQHRGVGRALVLVVDVGLQRLAGGLALLDLRGEEVGLRGPGLGGGLVPAQGVLGVDLD